MEEDKILKELSELVVKLSSAIGVFGILYDWIIKLVIAFNKEERFGIPAKYFFSYNSLLLAYNIIPLGFSIYIYCFGNFIIRVYNLGKRWKTLKNFITLFIYCTGVLKYNCIDSIGISICMSIALLALLTIFELFEEFERVLNYVIIIFILIISYFVITKQFDDKLQIYQVTKLEKITLKNNQEISDFVVLSEYEGKYLVVPYIIKKDSNCKKENTECKDKYVFISNIYRFINKTETTFSSIKLYKSQVEP